MITLEMAVAFAVLTMAFAAASPLLLGDQSLLADARAHDEALEIARQALERARVDAADDFGSVNPATSTQGIYQKTLIVEQTDLWTKKVVSDVAWKTEGGRMIDVRLVTLLTNRDLEDTCSSVVVGDWRRPSVATFDLAALIGDPEGLYPVTGLAAYDGRLYVTTSNSSANQPTFFVFDVSNLASPSLIGKMDNDPKSKTGPNAVAVAPSGGRIYAYLASASSFSRGQLQIVDVTEPKPSGWSPAIVTYKIPKSIVPTAGSGNSIFYRRGFVYLGLTATSGGGKEFNIIDVRDPLHPAWTGGYSLEGHDVNAVRAKNGYAYLAHPMDNDSGPKEQLTVLNVAGPADPRRIGGFYHEGGIGGHGKSVFTVGGTIYLGRTASKISGAADTIPEFFALDGENPGSIPPAPLGYLPLATAESINALVVRDRLAFLLTNTQLQIWNVADPAAMTPWTPHGSDREFAALPGKGMSMACEGNTLYVGSASEAKAGFLTIMTAP